MTLRRYTGLVKSGGTRIPLSVRNTVLARDAGCVGRRIGMPGDCLGRLEIDHVRSGGMGMKSPSTEANCVALCGGRHHPMKTEYGKEWRPLLLAYISDPFAPRYGFRGVEA